MKLLLITVIIFLLAACSSSTVYIVRHAEKSAPSGDVPLSAAGLERAQILADSMKQNLNAVYTTNTQRTRQTAQPSAVKYARNPAVYANGDSLLQQLLLERGRFLIVGHSNTVPQMLRANGLQPSFSGNIPDDVYSYLFVVKKKGKAAPTLQEKRYGAQ